MAAGVATMPRFEPMDLVLSSKAVAGFNLSFFSEEAALVDAYMQQIVQWAEQRAIRLAKVTAFHLDETPRAHELIQSGQSIGKLVLRPP